MWGPLDASIFTLDQTTKKLTKLTSIDSSQVGVFEFRYRVELNESGKQSAWSTPTFSIEVRDACPTATFTVPTQADPSDYTYTGLQTVFSFSAFAVSPTHCAVTYTCQTKAGPTTSVAEICAFKSGLNDKATFSGTTWTY